MVSGSCSEKLYKNLHYEKSEILQRAHEQIEECEIIEDNLLFHLTNEHNMTICFFEELFKEKCDCFCSANVTACVKVPKLAPDIFEFGHTRAHDIVYKVCCLGDLGTARVEKFLRLERLKVSHQLATHSKQPLIDIFDKY